MRFMPFNPIPGIRVSETCLCYLVRCPAWEYLLHFSEHAKDLSRAEWDYVQQERDKLEKAVAEGRGER